MVKTEEGGKRMNGFRYTVRELKAEANAADYVRDCVDVPKFLACCEACPNYQKRWSCPPFEFDPMDIWGSCQSIRLYARMLIPDFPGQDVPAAMDALSAEKEKYLDTLLDWERGSEGSLALAAGSCKICSACARTGGKPCRFPEKMRYSIESLGGDVGLTAEKYLGEPLLWIQDGILPAHLMLVGALLLPRRNRVSGR